MNAVLKQRFLSLRVTPPAAQSPSREMSNTSRIQPERKAVNSYGLSKKIVYQNEEFNLVQAG